MKKIARPTTRILLAQLALAVSAWVFSTPHVQAAAGDLFASDPVANTIRVYALDGSTRIFASGLSHPQGLVFDGLGNLYVADNGSGRVYRFTADGTRTIFATGLHKPVGIAFDGTQIGISELGTGTITRIDQDGVETVFDAVPDPLGLTFETPNLYLAGNDELNVIEPDHTLITYSVPGSVAAAVDGVGDAFVSSMSGTITEVTAAGAVSTFASGLSSPNGLAFRPKRYSDTEAGVGDLFVAETSAGTVSEFAADGVRKVFATGGNPKFLAFELILPGKLLNLSTRLNAKTGDDVLIGGFIVTGTVAKDVLLRAIGPSLSTSNPPIPGALEDTILELHKPDGTVVTNDDWRSDQEADIEATGIPPTDDRESAIRATLEPGAYTAIVRGKDNATGIAMVEAFDLAKDVDSELANISTRGFVQTGDDCMIGGFIIDPDENARVLVRGLGPSLADANPPVPNPLQDPFLELHDGNGTIVSSNDNWADTADGEISSTGIPRTSAKESSILSNLPGGNYTAILRGADNGIGVGLIEIYHLP